MSSSEASTPRFTAQAASAEDILKSQTVGLVQLDEFRKRRRDIQELKAQDSQHESDRAVTPQSDDGSAAPMFKKKKRKIAGRSLISFGDEEGNDHSSRASTPAASTGNGGPTPVLHSTTEASSEEPLRRRLTPNPSTSLPTPKVVTKASLAAEAAERDRLKKEFLEIQGAVRTTEVSIPFVFYDGSNVPGGTVNVKKGDHIWLLLERCRKVGAEMGVGGDRGDGTGAKAKVDGRKSWARIGVDDLMCVRGDIIIPHHYELYYFIANKVTDPNNTEKMLFDFSDTVDLKARAAKESQLLRYPKEQKLEGHDHHPSYTKIVDRRWYERNKHIYPSSMWKEYKPGKEFEESAKARKDAQGNSFFYA